MCRGLVVFSCGVVPLQGLRVGTDRGQGGARWGGTAQCPPLCRRTRSDDDELQHEEHTHIHTQTHNAHGTGSVSVLRLLVEVGRTQLRSMGKDVNHDGRTWKSFIDAGTTTPLLTAVAHGHVRYVPE